MKSLEIGICGVFVTASIACSGTESPEATYEQNAEALGEIGCATYGGYPYGSGFDGGGVDNGTTQTAVPLPLGVFGFNRADSPNTFHGSGPCPGQYILEVRNTGARSLW